MSDWKVCPKCKKERIGLNVSQCEECYRDTQVNGKYFNMQLCNKCQDYYDKGLYTNCNRCLDVEFVKRRNPIKATEVKTEDDRLNALKETLIKVIVNEISLPSTMVNEYNNLLEKKYNL